MSEAGNAKAKSSEAGAGTEAPEKPADAPARKASPLKRGLRLISPAMNARLVAVGAAGLALGTVIGVVSAPRDRSSDAVAAMRAEIFEARGEIRSLSEAAQRSDGFFASLREGLAQTRAGIDRREAAGSERLADMEKALASGFADLQTRRERDERELGSRLGTIVASIDKLVPPPPASKVKTDPDTTGALSETKAPTPDPAGEWALREVLDGVAVIEDRKRRVVEVSRGDVVPGLGRVEAVERRARSWVVVTKQGVVVPQNW